LSSLNYFFFENFILSKSSKDSLYLLSNKNIFIAFNHNVRDVATATTPLIQSLTLTPIVLKMTAIYGENTYELRYEVVIPNNKAKIELIKLINATTEEYIERNGGGTKFGGSQTTEVLSSNKFDFDAPRKIKWCDKVSLLNDIGEIREKTIEEDKMEFIQDVLSGIPKDAKIVGIRAAMY
jgi:hypothetical protein